jgi:hypothetical protein
VTIHSILLTWALALWAVRGARVPYAVVRSTGVALTPPSNVARSIPYVISIVRKLICSDTIASLRGCSQEAQQALPVQGLIRQRIIIALVTLATCNVTP